MTTKEKWTLAAIIIVVIVAILAAIKLELELVGSLKELKINIL